MGLIALSASCDQREKIFDFIADPVLPPLSNVDAGTYDHTFRVFLDKADNSDSRIFFTFDPELSYTQMDQWTDYYDSGTNGFDVSVSTSIRTFAYATPTRFSPVKTISWELKCPQAQFSYAPGNVNFNPADIYIYRPGSSGDTANFTVWYTLDGSDPADTANPSRLSIASGTNGVFCGTLNGLGASMTVRSLVQRTGWSDSDPSTAVFTIVPLYSGFTFVLNLPDGTTVGFSGQSPSLSASQSMTVNASPAGMASYRWTLNGQICVYASSPTTEYSGSSILLGGSASPTPATVLSAGVIPDLSDLPAGGYNLSCIAIDANGYMYSQSISFMVSN